MRLNYAVLNDQAPYTTPHIIIFRIRWITRPSEYNFTG